MSRPPKVLGLVVSGLCVLAAGAHAQMYSQIESTATVTLADEMARGLAPASLAQGDWDGDGTPDLMAGFAAARGGRLVLLRGNPDAVYPNSPEARKRQALGRAARAPFAGRQDSFAVPTRPELLAAGDFDGDGNLDAVAGARDKAALAWLRGDGRGGFDKPRIVPLPGVPTALAAGESNRRDGLEDLAVAVIRPTGPELIVFDSRSRTFDGVPESFRLPAIATSMAFGQLDGAFPRDLAVAAGGIDDLAVLTADGEVEVLLPGRVDNPTGRGFFVLDRKAGRVGLRSSPTLFDLDWADGEIVAFQPMRLNPDGLDDLAVLDRNGRIGVVFAAASITYTVNTTSDTNDGVCNAAHCSLREAITLANANTGADVINFNIAGTGVKTIAPSSALPIITDTVTIDGTTQPGYAGSPRIEINGASAGAASGLQINASNCVVRALAINRFSLQAGIYLYSPSTSRSGNIVEGNRLGTDPSGTIARANGDGVTIAGLVNSTTVGGTSSAARNTLSGNVSTGVYIAAGSSNTVINNFIGTKTGGSGALGNAYDGIYNNGSSTTIGGAYGNIIGNNGQYGIQLRSSNALVQGNFIGGDAMVGGPNTQGGIYATGSNNTIAAISTGVNPNQLFNNTGSAIKIASYVSGNQIRRNLIYANGGLGIDLNGDGVTANDAGDGDTGGNTLQNFPVITSASTSAVAISLNSTPNSTFAIDVFSADTGGCDPTGHGEGQWVNSGTITTNASGNGSVVIPVSWGGIFTATATGPGNNTSEFSACRTAGT